MKKIFLVPAMFALLTASVFADNGKNSARVSSRVSRQFESDFVTAQNVNWTVNGNLEKADFTVNGEKMTAFYNATGEYLGLTHEVNAQAIPAKAMKQINEDYKGYAVKEVIVYQTNEAVNPDIEPVSYFVDLTKDSKEILVRITNAADLEFFKQVK